ncbi:hypothetical protein K3495_g5899 [Podosphaera aphanis]|nr:hypothetical protein K3495_g5899 [Podosphaera aphanis]
MSSLSMTTTPAPREPSRATTAAPGVTPPAEVKPCCVCKEEKAARDNCMLISTSAEPQQDCVATIEKYKQCMAGFGFHLP